MAYGTCKVDGCDTVGRVVRSMCNAHYLKWYRHGDPLWTRPGRAQCKYDGCTTVSHAGGYCGTHYSRIRRTGTPAPPSRVDPNRPCTKCGETKPLSEYWTKNGQRHSWCKVCHRVVALANYEKNRERRVQAYRDLRAAALRAYGGLCQCCGENTYEFLAIDHIHGGGREDRESSGNSGWGFLLTLQREGFPQDRGLQVLCHNCNCAKGFYGACPHEEKR